jgi:hypothetical protein
VDIGIEKRFGCDSSMKGRVAVGHKDAHPETDSVPVSVLWVVSLHSEDLFVCSARMAGRVCRQGTHTYDEHETKQTGAYLAFASLTRKTADGSLCAVSIVSLHDGLCLGWTGDEGQGGPSRRSASAWARESVPRLFGVAR